MRSNKIDKAMRTLHASDNLYDRVLAESRQRVGRVRGHGVPKPGRLALCSIPVVAAIGIAIAAMGGIAVSAVSNSELFAKAFAPRGDNGSSQVTWDAIGGADDSKRIPCKQEYRTIVAEDVLSDMENEVEAVGKQLHAWGYTMTIRDMIADENGCGVARFSLDNPGGLHLATQYGAKNEIVFDGSNDCYVGGMYMECANGVNLNTYSFYDEETLSDTHLDGTMYFTPIGDIDRADDETPGAATVMSGVKWYLNGPREGRVYSEVFTPSGLLETRKFRDQQSGNTCYVSPFSIWFKDHYGIRDSLKLNLSDGSSWTVLEDDLLNAEDVNIFNTYVQSGVDSHPDAPGEALIMSGLVDPEQVNSITSIKLEDASTSERTYLPTS